MNLFRMNPVTLLVARPAIGGQRNRRSVTALFALSFAATLLTAFPHAARSRDQYEPISISVPFQVVAGDTLPVSFQLNGADGSMTTVTAYSPDGSMFGQTTVTTASGVVNVPTNPSAAAGPETIVVKTDGAQTVSALTTIVARATY